MWTVDLGMNPGSKNGYAVGTGRYDWGTELWGGREGMGQISGGANSDIERNAEFE